MDLESEDAKIKLQLLEQLRTDPYGAMIEWCHKGIHMECVGPKIRINVCSFEVTGDTYHDAVTGMLNEIRKRVESGDQGC